jgi:hypothetical protein
MRNTAPFGRKTRLALAAIVLITACDGGDGSSSDEEGSEPDAVTGEETTLTFGPVDVPAGTENTQCVTKRLGNTSEFKVGSIHNELIGVSHHLVIYRVNDTEERLEPYDCEPFADTLNAKNGAPLMITQRSDELLELPEGLAFVLPADQMIRLEMHFVNPGDEDATIEARSTFHPIADSDFENDVGFLFAGSLDIALPPGESTQVEAFIEAPLELYETSFFGFTGHTHKLGTNVVVEMGERAGPTQAVYDVEDFAWSEPPTVYHDPPVVLPDDGRFHIACDYENTTDQEVRFGESASAEMCFFWGYYYPSAGAHVCFQTNRAGVSINLCCPGSPLCP